MMDTFFSSSEKRAMGTVLLTLAWPETTDSLVTDSLPSVHKAEEEGREEGTLLAVLSNNQIELCKVSQQHRINQQ